MADPPQELESDPFDISKIRQLIRLMRDNDLTELDLRRGDCWIRLQRGPQTDPVIVAGAPARESKTAANSVTAPVSGVLPTADRPTSEKYVPITSPIVGTFYAAASPEAEPFVKVGSKVTPETIVCVIEAMKVFNEIPAGVAGTIIEALVENGAPVEYGQRLFRVET